MSFVVRLEVDDGDAVSDSGLRLAGEQKAKMLVYCPWQSERAGYRAAI